MMFKEIKDISLDAAKLVTEFGSPEMTESLDIIKQITASVQNIMESLEDPEMSNSIENMRLALRSMQEARDRMKNVSYQVRDTSISNETKTIRSKIGSANSEQDLKGLIKSFRDTAKSVRGLAAELKRTI